MIGVKALQAGLVHDLGGIDAAISVAKQLADIGATTDVDLMVLESGNSFTLPMPSSKAMLDYVVELSQPQLWAVDPILWGVE